jgi:D-glucosaminate-6-phosphate ammonia-lyase
MTDTIYDRLGTKPAINARGIYTDLGGSSLAPSVWAAMADANRYFVDISELLETSGQIIANLVGAEAARVTPGASAAIVLGIAGCMTGDDGAKMEQLPDTTGMPNEVLIQRWHRYKYDRLVPFTGARLIEVGGDAGTTVEQLAAVIGPKTAALFFPAHLDGIEGTVPLAEFVAVGKRRNVPVLVDAAYLNYPIEMMRDLIATGADLTCFSAKYFGGPNTGGFICGRRDLVDTVAGVDFTRYESGEHRIYGRPFKLDRQMIVAVVVAFQEWVNLDHDARLEGWERKVQTIQRRLRDIPSVELIPMSFTMAETLEPEPINCLHIRVDPQSGKTAAQVESALRAGNPTILTHLRDDSIIVVVETLADGDEETVAGRLRDALVS